MDRNANRNTVCHKYQGTHAGQTDPEEIRRAAAVVIKETPTANDQEESRHDMQRLGDLIDRILMTRPTDQRTAPRMYFEDRI